MVHASGRREEKLILALFAKIQQDFRHRNILTLANGPIAQRHFTAWLMGFKVLTPDAFTQLAGYTDPTSAAFQQALGATHDDLIRHLLEAFVAGMPAT